MSAKDVKKKSASGLAAVESKTVTVFLRASLCRLLGAWHWEMNAPAVFCSDVMLSLPPDFDGAKAIFHPDDLEFINEQLTGKQQIPFLRFRIITTYGEVKTLTGENITVDPHDGGPTEWLNGLYGSLINKAQHKIELAHLQTLQQVHAQNSHATGTGAWYCNASSGKTWFDDAVFVMHGLPPQSLNAHLHTFQACLHPYDKDLVIEFTDRAFAQRMPLQIEYRVMVCQKEKWLRYTARWVRSETGEDIFGGLLHDVTHYKTAEQEAENWRSLAQFQKQQLLFNEKQTGTGHWQVDLLTRKATYSDQYYRIFGLKPQTLPSHINAFLHYIHPDDQDLAEAINKKIIHEHAMPDSDFRIQRADGKVRCVRKTGRLLTVDGAVIVSGVLEDVTVQRMLEKRLAEVNEQLAHRQLQQQQSDETAHQASWVMDVQTGDIHWSNGTSILVGYKMGAVQMTLKTFWSFIHPHDVKEFKERWSLMVQERVEAAFGFRLLLRGAVRNMKALFRLHNANGKTLFVGTVQDVTAEQVLEQHLAQRVHLAECLSENSLDRVLITNESNTIVLWNRACEKAYGLKKEEAIGQNFFDIFPQLKTEAEMALFLRAMRGEVVMQEERSSVSGSGYYNLHLVPLWRGKNEVGILHILRDVTKETELRRKLQDRLLFIESLVESSVDRIVALDRNMTYQYWNIKAQEYYGLAKENVVGKNILEVFPQLVNDPSYSQLRKALRGETIYISANPEQDKFFETYLIPIKDERGDVVNLLWITHDLAGELRMLQEQRKVQQQLREEHRRMQEAEAMGHVGSFEWTLGSEVSQWSDELYRINGLEPRSEEATLEKAHNFIHPDDRAEFEKRKQNSIESGGRHHYVHRIVRRDGEVRWVNHQWDSLMDEWGKVMKVSGVVQDITEQRKTAQDLKSQTAFAQTIVDASIDQITIFDRNERFLVWNKKAEEAGGLKREEVIGKTISQVFPNIAGEPEFIEAQQKALAGEYVYIPAKRGIYSRAYQQWFYIPLKDENGHTYAVLNIIHDITDKVEAEKALLQKNKELESKNEEITRFAFIASHDLKEPIRKIHTFSNWLMENEADSLSIKGKEYAFKISTSVKRLGVLIDDITTLTQVQAVKSMGDCINLNEVLHEAEEDLKEKIESRGAVIESKNLPVVSGNRKQLVHLFRNLLSNSIKFQQLDVIPVIEISSRHSINPAGLPPGEYVQLSIADNGVGFDPQFSEKIFRVFQRLHSQEQYTGTGIGLAICKKIMENHGGGIKAESEVNKGSVFHCYFPV